MMKNVGEMFTPEVKNNLYKEGFRFVVSGDYKVLDTVDPRDGMPIINNNHYVFTEKKEAEEFALTQTFPLTGNCPKVYEIPEHTETWADIIRESEEEKAKKEAKEREKAKKAGMSLEEFREFKKLEAKKRRYAREITKMKEEIENLKKEIERKENFLKNH